MKAASAQMSEKGREFSLTRPGRTVRHPSPYAWLLFRLNLHPELLLVLTYTAQVPPAGILRGGDRAIRFRPPACIDPGLSLVQLDFFREISLCEEYATKSSYFVPARV